MRIRLAVPEAATSPETLDPILEAVTRTNERLLESGNVPTAAEAIADGVKWKPEPPGDEHFDNAATVARRGHGDCDDLAPWHAASLRHTGEDPEAKAIVVKSGPKRWHAVVLRSDGQVDDPSADAGMYDYHAPLQPRLRGPEHRINVATKKVNGVWCARCDVPWVHARHAISGHAMALDRGGAVLHAVQGVLITGDSAGIVEPEHLVQLAGMSDLIRGVPSDEVAESLGAMGAAKQFGRVLKAAKHVGPARRPAVRRGANRQVCYTPVYSAVNGFEVVGDDELAGYYSDGVAKYVGIHGAFNSV